MGVSAEEKRGTVNSVRRAIMVLRIISEEKGASVTEVAVRLGVHKSTASRLIATLIEEQFLEKDPLSGRILLGREAFRLSGSAGAWGDLVKLARPVLVELAVETGTTVNLGVLSGGEVIHIDQVNDPRSIVNVNWVGRSAPLHCTSMGKVLVAFAPPTERERLLSYRLVAHTPGTITDPQRLGAELEAVRADGIARSMDEYEVGLNGVSAPVRRPDGTVIAAVCASGPSFLLGPFNLSKVEEATRKAADRISRSVGA